MNIKKIWTATWYVVETAAHWPSVDTVEIIFVAPLIIVYREYDFIPIPIPTGTVIIIYRQYSMIYTG